jgi:hypothetical protein
MNIIEGVIRDNTSPIEKIKIKKATRIPAGGFNKFSYDNLLLLS